MDRVERFTQKGYLCSEAVLLTLSEFVKVKSDVIPKIATGFGAGIGRHGEVCGALTGAIMGLGLCFGRSDVSETPPNTSPYEFSQKMVDLFLARFGHVRCRDLLGLDLSCEESREAYKEKSLWETRCRQIIQTATGIAFDLLQAQFSD